MRFSVISTLAALLISQSPVWASTDIPMVAIGLPFEPETPEPVVVTHPLYQRIQVDEIEGLPTSVKSSALNFIAAAKRSSVNKALKDSFGRMNILAPTADRARFQLHAQWVGSQTPFRIATRNAASVTMHYQLVRMDNGQVLFDRNITTSAKGGGVDASMRDNGIIRAAIAANFASAANCLDRAAYGTAPSDCALTPKFSVVVERR
ncbi:hypothetical protein [uncultured Novosphingobium sp.]|uniref:hypothetical protein n=1 Tax=uncultured Novosphingobium sp. TaxID=292277 RepID=UPI002588BCFD|nr:hypothetical protein [uncultured Novosphingobium sp.]